jgi:hypothetical protein
MLVRDLKTRDKSSRHVYKKSSARATLDHQKETLVIMARPCLPQSHTFLLNWHASLIVQNVRNSAELAKDSISGAMQVNRWVKRYVDGSGVDRARTAEDLWFILKAIEDMDIYVFRRVMTCITRVSRKW